jgi:hypothetical protein
VETDFWAKPRVLQERKHQEMELYIRQVAQVAGIVAEAGRQLRMKRITLHAHSKTSGKGGH